MTVKVSDRKVEKKDVIYRMSRPAPCILYHNKQLCGKLCKNGNEMINHIVNEHSNEDLMTRFLMMYYSGLAINDMDDEEKMK